MSDAHIHAVRLRTEYLENPIGIDEALPRLSWWVQDARDGARQSGYRVRAATTREALSHPDLADTGKVESDQQVHVELPKLSAKSRQRVWWDVQLWDEQGRAGRVSEPAFFEWGLLDRNEWKAQYVATSLEGTGRHSPAVPLLRREFELPREVTQARLYVTALGLHEVHINGRKASEDWLRPGWTEYRTRLAYQTYDVTALLRRGGNVIGAMLGDGWWCGHVGPLERGMLYGPRPALLAQLEVTCSDGSRHLVCSDETWRWQEGPILGSDMLAGEEYDARKEQQGWSEAGFDASHWRAVRVEAWHEARLVASPAPPVRVVRELEPVADPVPAPGEWGQAVRVYDFGQNLPGVVRLRVRGPRGCTIRLRYAEVVKPKGGVDVSNLRSARATDVYTLRGDPQGEVFTPRFTWHGFRYVELSVQNEWFKETPLRPALQPLDRNSVTALVLMSDLPQTGQFETDHALLNQLQSNIQWGQRGNFLEVPTDCPQRDERLGWTGDAQVFAPTAAFNMDVAAFFTKWMRDIDDAQLPDGGVPSVAPNLLGDYDSGPGWSDARVVIPWAMYQAYADRRMLERHYPSMRRWMQHHIDSAKDGLRCYEGCHYWRGYGDWLALDGDGIDAMRNATPKDLIGTAYYAYALGIMIDVAQALGHHEDLALFRTRREEAAAAFRHHYFNAKGRCVIASQTSYLMALGFDLLPESMREEAMMRLVGLLKDRGNHLSTGFLGTPLLCPVLTKMGRLDLAYELLLKTDYPSWLYPVKLGATTMWERWNSWDLQKGFVEVGMNSLNHYAYGAVGQWMVQTVGGLSPLEVGYKRVLFQPRPGGGLHRASVRFDSIHGPISSEWRIAEGRLALSLHLPANVTGRAVLPDGSSHDLSAGERTLSCEFRL